MCNENGIEILSPHCRYARDGNMTSIPSEYISEDYEAPVFNVKIKREENDEPEPDVSGRVI